ncbi:MAG: hypothetical protein WDO13_06665 [Verrucomicrobiota bacterium]
MNLGIEHVFKLGGGGELTARFDVLNVFDQSYLLNDGTGVGEGAVRVRRPPRVFRRPELPLLSRGLRTAEDLTTKVTKITKRGKARTAVAGAGPAPARRVAPRFRKPSRFALRPPPGGRGLPPSPI